MDDRRPLAIVAGGPVPSWLGLIGLPVGLAVAIGALEFVGRNEPQGRSIGTLVPIAYLAWSVWLLALGDR